MKKYLFVVLSAFALFSCDNSENPEVSKLPQDWNLIGYKSSWVADPQLIPVTDSIYNYRLEKNGSFVKNIGKYRLTGTFEFGVEDSNWVTLTYDEASLRLNEDSERNLIHYCGQNYEPFKLLDSKTVSGSWGECDGPNFIFARRK